MVIGENEVIKPAPAPPPASIDNIMSGINYTGTVKMNNHRKKLRQRFDIIKKLGQGTYGKVQLGINKETGQEVAIKTIKKCKIETDADLVRIRREVQIMSSVQHPNIIHIYEVFENREKMVLVMEFAAGGELYDYLSERKVLSEEEARRVFRQISTAVYYCHKHKICHRDLKLENILLDENGNAKIADFGLSNVFDEQRLLATFCGSPLYASPEIVKGTPYLGPEVDCWSLGVLLYTLVYGAMPFDGSNFKRLVKQISAGDYYEPKKPSPASPLIKDMLTVCPQRRATIEQICNHWWVNEGYQDSCLDVAEELANQTPVRLDVLLSLAPSAVTSDQLVVPGPVEDTKASERVARSHSVGSIRDMGNTEAERRILDMVAAGGEAALAPSPTRTITPYESPAQPKRKLETTLSTENAMVGGSKKREKPTEQLRTDPSKMSIVEMMETEPTARDFNSADDQIMKSSKNIVKDFAAIDNICDELINESYPRRDDDPDKKKFIQKSTDDETSANNNNNNNQESIQKPSDTIKAIKKPFGKTKTIDLRETINDIGEPKGIPERKNSLPDGGTERRRSRIFEAAEKFENKNNAGNDKGKKIIIPGVSVGNFKKEFERKVSLTNAAIANQPAIGGSTPTERRSLEKRGSDSSTGQQSNCSRKSSIDDEEMIVTPIEATTPTDDLNKHLELHDRVTDLKESDSKSSISNFSLEEARRSMENSIALLNQAKTESSKEVDQLCAQTENVAVSENDPTVERQKKLKNAREIIGNAIPVGRLCTTTGVRKPPVPFGMNGRSTSGGIAPSSLLSGSGNDKKSMRLQVGPEPTDVRTATLSVSTPEQKMYDREPLSGGIIPKPVAVGTLIDSQENPNNNTTKTSRAEIILKSATLPRRKTSKAEIQLDVKQKPEQQMRFQTEMQHNVPDLRSAPIREHPYTPPVGGVNHRSTSLEPQQKEHIISVQRPGGYQRVGAPTSTTTSSRSGTLSRQSTNDSDTDTTTTMQSQSQSQLSTSASSQPIKKSPREFIIPIAVEGGGYVTPRAGSLEPSDSNHTTSSMSFNRIGRPRKIGSLLTDRDSEEDSPFLKLHRHTSIGRESDNDEPRFAMHRLRSTRPVKKIIPDPSNDSGSSGEDDDEDGFEILTAENLFSTLLSRVRALTNRLNVTNDPASRFPTSTFMSNLRQTHSPFWHHDPFGSRLNNGSGAWRHSMSRDLSTDIDSMFSRSGATLPRGTKFKPQQNQLNYHQNSKTSSLDNSNNNNNNNHEKNNNNINNNNCSTNESLDLGDLDLSRLRLTKKDLETLSTITPELPKHFQEQLLAQLPPNQAKKLSRTLSMQNGSKSTKASASTVKIYKRSLSGGKEFRSDYNNLNPNDDPDDVKAVGDGMGSITNSIRTVRLADNINICDNENSVRNLSSSNDRKNQTRDLYNSRPSSSNNNNNNNNNIPDRNAQHRSSYTNDDKYKKYSVCNDTNLITSGTINSNNTSTTSTTPSNVNSSSSSTSPLPPYSGGGGGNRYEYEKSISPSSSSTISHRYYDTLPPPATRAGCLSPPMVPREYSNSRLPSDCISPPPQYQTIGDHSSASSLRRRSSNRISRFLRPDFYDQQPASIASSLSVTTQQHDNDNSLAYHSRNRRREREIETQNVLREIRERSRDRCLNSKRDNNIDYDKLRATSVISSNPSTNEVISNKNDKNRIDAVDTIGKNGKEQEPMAHSNNSRKIPYNHQSSSFNNIEFSNKIIDELNNITMSQQLKNKMIINSTPTSTSNNDINNNNINDGMFIDSNGNANDNCYKHDNVNSNDCNKTNDKPDKSETIIKTEKMKVKKIKSKDKHINKTISDSMLKQETIITTRKTSPPLNSAAISNKEIDLKNINNINMVTSLTNEIDSIALPKSLIEGAAAKPKKESKLIRPKSYPNKDSSSSIDTLSKKQSPDLIDDVQKEPPQQLKTNDSKLLLTNEKCTPSSDFINDDKSQSSSSSQSVTTKISRPKSYPNSKLINPRDNNNKLNKSGTILSTQQSPPPPPSSSSSSSNADCTEKSNTKLSSVAIIDTTQRDGTIKTIKPIKTIKKSIKPDAKDQTSSSIHPKESTTINESKTIEMLKEKSPEKKINKGFLFNIGQKFEKLRENSRNNKEKKLLLNTTVTNKLQNEPEPNKQIIEPKISKKLVEQPSQSVAPTTVTPHTNSIEDAISENKEKSIKFINHSTTTPTTTTTTPSTTTTTASAAATRKSKIDTMIRNLRERSIPRGPILTESNLIKRAVSVEDMITGGGVNVGINGPTFNKCGVNKVLGLFKKIEREQNEYYINNSINNKSFSNNNNNNNNNNLYNSNNSNNNCDNYNEHINDDKERPKSGGFVSKLKKGRPYVGAKSDTIVTLTDQLHKLNVEDNKSLLVPQATPVTTKIPSKLNSTTSPSVMMTTTMTTKLPSTTCVDCLDSKNTNDITTKRHSNQTTNTTNNYDNHDTINNNNNNTTNELKECNNDKERMRNNRKGLVLELDTNCNKLKSNRYTNLTNTNNINNNNINNNCNNIINNTNNGSHQNQQPTYDALTNYSSDSRSVQDDCASTSTFLSPTDEPELYFDDWSICSDDNNYMTTPSPSSYTRLSRNSHNSSPSHRPVSASLSTRNHTGGSSIDENNESVIDRIKRKSFYSRFNEKKPKRQSTIVGPAAKEYYRESAAKLKSRPPERMDSPSSVSSERTANNNSRQSNCSDPPYHHHHHHHHYHPVPHSHMHHHHHQPVHDHSNTNSNNNHINCSDDDCEKMGKTSSRYDDDLRNYRYSDYTSRLTNKPNYLPPPSSSSSIYSSSSRNHITTPTTNPTGSSSSSTAAAHDYNRYNTDYLGNIRSGRSSDLLSSTVNPSSASSLKISSATSPSALSMLYGTYNPKRRISYGTPNGSVTTATNTAINSNSNNIGCTTLLDGYATIGRKQRPYDHRSISLLDSSSSGSSIYGTNTMSPISNNNNSNVYRRESRPVSEFGNITRPNIRIRTPSIPRSPTNN